MRSGGAGGGGRVFIGRICRVGVFIGRVRVGVAVILIGRIYRTRLKGSKPVVRLSNPGDSILDIRFTRVVKHALIQQMCPGIQALHGALLNVHRSDVFTAFLGCYIADVT